jgi:hypothetical protein
MHTANTPAEARTGISDRAAAALKDVAELRARFDRGVMVGGETALLDRIAAALRERTDAVTDETPQRFDARIADGVVEIFDGHEWKPYRRVNIDDPGPTCRTDEY